MVYAFKAEIVKAKADGAVKSGAYHWLLQRITGLVLALCSIWLIYFTLTNKNSDLSIIMLELKKPFNVVALLITVIISLYHAILGMQAVIEDYINCNNKLRNALIIVVKLFCLVTIASFVMVMLYER
ncbi:succinate dehydrogenase, hydrophobic membrane anchor protein [Rickettsia oklahomensis]|uniref:Succinate dehydrogenase hydrophobic membrane anchor subunit n=1 Tax=Rickettsia oklahomensis TaxID=3141789 RepID=A0AAU7C0T9_9RICK